VSAPIVLRAGWRAVKVVPPASNARPATLCLLPNREAPDADLLAQALQACRDLGIRHAITQALRTPEHPPLLALGGTLIQQLHLLSLQDPPASRRWSGITGPGVQRHAPDQAIANLDHAAFGGFWHFDTVALDDAMSATQEKRLRSVVVDNQPLGYLICGCTETRGFIQRIAVHPEHEGKGYATALLTDAVGWLGRRGAQSVTINTQIDNVRARTLYERNDFVLQPERLGVIGFSTGVT
jgi:ribosomal protein S18 acetylase RimI-like enzyme